MKKVNIFVLFFGLFVGNVSWAQQTQESFLKDEKIAPVFPSTKVGVSTGFAAGSHGYGAMGTNVQVEHQLNNKRRRRQATYSASMSFSHQSSNYWGDASTMLAGAGMWFPLNDKMDLQVNVRGGNQWLSGGTIITQENAYRMKSQSRPVYDVDAQLNYRISEKVSLHLGVRTTNMGYPYSSYYSPYGSPYGYGLYGGGFASPYYRGYPSYYSPYW
ncbi:MAG: hypothetical protein MI784_02510 [Cytophagales bacterium]|nr:hypothetical protein [Cytophagales bacterium]